MNIVKWIDRKFNFDFPAGLFYWIMERVQGTPARADEIIRTLPPNILTIKPENGWSIQENIGHLIKVEELHDGRIDDYLNGADVLRPADMENVRTQEADYNSESIETILEKFRAVRMNFVKRMNVLDDDLIAKPILHPRLNQPMRPVDMAYFVAEHDDYHLAVIRRLAHRG